MRTGKRLLNVLAPLFKPLFAGITSVMKNGELGLRRYLEIEGNRPCVDCHRGHSRRRFRQHKDDQLVITETLTRPAYPVIHTTFNAARNAN